jgi:NAD(P)-dependent dehydrogenase (short-subunit alcohol dehydrogenase family)
MHARRGKMGDKLKAQGAIVTGAGRGIGREIALALAAEGAKVVIADPGVSMAGDGFDSAPADDTAAEIRKRGGTAVANYGSVVDPKACEEIIRSCIENFGRLDILVNVAGIVRPGLVWELSDEDWDAVIKTHLYGTFYTTGLAARIMKEQRRGRIINTVSRAAYIGRQRNSNYTAAKGGITGFSYTVALELSGFGVTCNMISPGAATRLTSDEVALKQDLDADLELGFITKEEYEKRLPLLKSPSPDVIGGAEHIPPMVVYLCAEEASHINGQIFEIGRGSISIYSEPRQLNVISNNGEIWSLEQLAELVPKKLMTGPVPDPLRRFNITGIRPSR